MEGGKMGGGEIRRVHIIYLLSRRGRVEQPHLIRVHHLNKNGVRLRDVKRWLSDLRGKDMPHSFAWSYKRRYKKGYVWQDLLDDDLVTPISDNEFVLKGSEIVTSDYCLYSEGNIIQRATSDPKKETQTTMEISPAFGSARSSLTDDSTKYEEEKPLLSHSKETDLKSEKLSSFSSPNNNNGISVPSPATCAERKSNTNTNRGSLLRNLLPCIGAETNDTVLVMRRSNGEICKEEKLGGSARVLGTHWKNGQEQQQNARRSYDGGVNNAKKDKETNGHNNKPCKPFHAPTCSQCGKPFKPEKMHTHMKSCRGIKGNAAFLATSSQTQSALTPFLTN